jgi:hypothetical protein
MGEISHVANVGVNHWVKSVYLLWSWVSALGSFTFSGELNEVFVIESSVGLGDLWVKSVNLFWLKGLGLRFNWVFLGKSVENADAIGGELIWSAAISLLLLNKVEFIALHGDVFSHIFISVHASSEQLVRFWSLNECLCSSEEQGNNVGGLLVHF